MRVIVCLDGVDGAGKTTIVESLRHLFYHKFADESYWSHYNFRSIKFPTDAPESWDSVEPDWFQEDFRKAMIRDYTNSDGNEDGILICDRSFMSTAAYQGEGCLDKEVEIISEGFVNFMSTNCDLLLLVNVTTTIEDSLKRISKRMDPSNPKDLVERMMASGQYHEAADYLESVAKRFSRCYNWINKGGLDNIWGLDNEATDNTYATEVSTYKTSPNEAAAKVLLSTLTRCIDGSVFKYREV